MNKRKRRESAEQRSGQFFLDWLNRTYDFDYQLVPNTEENSPIDLFGKSDNLPTLNVQSVTSEGETIAAARHNTRSLNSEYHKILEVRRDAWILTEIKKKEARYPDEVKEEVILVIEGGAPTPRPDEVDDLTGELQKAAANSTFKGVYFVKGDKLLAARNQAIASGEYASEIEFVDATLKPSASKRVHK